MHLKRVNLYPDEYPTKEHYPFNLNIFQQTKSIKFHSPVTWKAVLIAKDVPFPKTHNIRTLLDLLPEDINLPLKIKDGAILTDYAVTMHYPGNFEPIDEKEYQQSVRLAEAVVYWAEKTIHE